MVKQRLQERIPHSKSKFFFLERISIYGVRSWWSLFIIKLKYQSVFGVGRDWTSYLIKPSETLPVELTRIHRPKSKLTITLWGHDKI